MDFLVYGPAGNELIPAASEFLEIMLGEHGAYRYLNNFLATWPGIPAAPPIPWPSGRADKSALHKR